MFSLILLTSHLLLTAPLIKSHFRNIRSDASLVPPIRQTASIFKQPVTVIKTQEGKVKSDLKHGSQEKPKQLFWEKRLEVCIESYQPSLWRLLQQILFNFVELPSLWQWRDRIHPHRPPQATQTCRTARQRPNTFPISRDRSAHFHASGDRTNIIEDCPKHQPRRFRQSRPAAAVCLLDFWRRHSEAGGPCSACEKEASRSSRQLIKEISASRDGSWVWEIAAWALLKRFSMSEVCSLY